MAVDQPGAKASPAAPATSPTSASADNAATGASPGSAQAETSPATKPEMDEVKRKFREALDRKRATHASGSADGAQDTGKVHGSHGPAANRRSFRRKSG